MHCTAGRAVEIKKQCRSMKSRENCILLSEWTAKQSVFLRIQLRASSQTKHPVRG